MNDYRVLNDESTEDFLNAEEEGVYPVRKNNPLDGLFMANLSYFITNFEYGKV